MILKIKALDNQAEEAWLILDDVKELHVSRYRDMEARKEPGIAMSDVRRIDMIDEHSPIKGGLFIACKSHGQPHHIYSNTGAYLLSDAGKTIERLM